MLEIGDTHHLSKQFSEEEVRQFGEISQDLNPLHFDDNFAKTTRFGRRILHGHLVTSLFSGILGIQYGALLSPARFFEKKKKVQQLWHFPNSLPGKGSIYLSQTFKYVAPVFLGDTVTAKVKVLDISQTRAIVTMETLVEKQDGTLCVSGEAKVMVPREYLASKES